MKERSLEQAISEPIKDATEITSTVVSPVVKRVGSLVVEGIYQEYHATKQRRIMRNK